MIKLIFKKKAVVRHAEVLLDDEGGVRVRKGPASRLREIHTPASLIQGAAVDFRDSKVDELLREGFHVVEAEHVASTSVFTFEARFDEKSMRCLVDALLVRGVLSDTGVLDVLSGGPTALGRLRGKSVGKYGWPIALAFASVFGTQTTIRDGSGQEVTFKDVFDRVVPYAELSEQQLETFYSTDVLPRPLRIEAFTTRRHRAQLTI